MNSPNSKTVKLEPPGRETEKGGSSKRPQKHLLVWIVPLLLWQVWLIANRLREQEDWRERMPNLAAMIDVPEASLDNLSLLLVEGVFASIPALAATALCLGWTTGNLRIIGVFAGVVLWFASSWLPHFAS